MISWGVRLKRQKTFQTESEPSPLKLGGSFTFLWDTSWTWERPITCDAEVFVSVCVAVAFGGVALTDLLRCGAHDTSPASVTCLPYSHKMCCTCPSPYDEQVFLKDHKVHHIGFSAI
uniref:Uncharacterized protein n=1 Tax=Anguilla anguilla TaxID=7936 RepID=A0A0E9SM09_ANGAN